MSSATMHFEYGLASSSTIDLAAKGPESSTAASAADWSLFSLPSQASYMYAPGSAFSASPSPSAGASPADDMEQMTTPPSSSASVHNYATSDGIPSRSNKASLAPIDIAAANAASFDMSTVHAFSVDMSPSLDSQPRRPATSHVAGSMPGRLSTGGSWHSVGRCTSADVGFSMPTHENGAPVSSNGALGGLNITWDAPPRSDAFEASSSSFVGDLSTASSSASSSAGPDTPFTTAATVALFSPFPADGSHHMGATPATSMSSYPSPFFLQPIPMCPDGSSPSVLGGHPPATSPSPMIPQGAWTGSAPTVHRAHLGFQQQQPHHSMEFGMLASPMSSASSSAGSTSVPLSWVPSFQGLPSASSNPTLFAPNGRILLACSFCKYRKLRCDGGLPQCTQCQKRGNQCCYPTEVRRRGKAKKTKLKEAKEAEAVAAAAAAAAAGLSVSLPARAESNATVLEDANRALKRRKA